MQFKPRPPAAVAPPRPLSKPVACMTVAPVGRSNKTPRDYQIKLAMDLVGIEPKYADRKEVMETAKGILAPFGPKDGAPNPCKFSEVATRPGAPVVAVEAILASSGRPHGALVEQIRARAMQEGYRVTVRETRECSHSNCDVEVVVPWTHVAEVPQGWYKDTICGKHQYRTCAQCQSVYIMSNVNAAGQAPSVKCEVCGEALVAWGSSKVWSAQLVTRGVPVV